MCYCKPESKSNEKTYRFSSMSDSSSSRKHVRDLQPRIRCWCRCRGTSIASQGAVSSSYSGLTLPALLIFVDAWPNDKWLLIMSHLLAFAPGALASSRLAGLAAICSWHSVASIQSLCFVCHRDEITCWQCLLVWLSITWVGVLHVVVGGNVMWCDLFWCLCLCLDESTM